ncbi:uncharacterized protein [Diabrotica undecimpunctata]|uniref:uncharacterized protein n=1 Tax=Diabrotica undecimpunctata TaxID=50387 RepID=UPI003B636CAD
MKYLVFFVCTVAYVAGTSVDLATFLGATTDPCACRQSLDNILSKIKDQNSNLKNSNTTLNNIENQILNVSVEVDVQQDKLCRIQDTITVIIQVENNTSAVLTSQICTLTDIVNDLIEICGNTECMENDLEDQNCILENIENVSLAAVEDCNGDTCRPTIGIKG